MTRRGSPAVNYSLRPAKNIERKMMAEAFARFSAICPLSQYRYIGFGSEFFNDFSLFHQTLGIHDMTSMERDANKVARCEFNRPFKCIKVVAGESRSILPTLGWLKRSLVWLDYTDGLNTSILDDAAYLVSQVRSGSILVWTVNVHPTGDERREGPAAPSDAGHLPDKRLAQLRQRVGEKRVRAELKGSELAQWGLAAESYRILREHIERAVNDRNGAAAGPARLEFHQFLHFQYRDGQRMLTVGGTLVDGADRDRMGKKPFNGLSFVRTKEVPLLVEPPTLTGREVRYLNRLLPRRRAPSKKPGWLTNDERESYRQIYRYYPIFAESEL
jgi:hypothetical protein